MLVQVPHFPHKSQKLIEHKILTQMKEKEKSAPRRLQAKIDEQIRLKDILTERAEKVEHVKGMYQLEQAKYKYDAMLEYFSGAEGAARAFTIGGLVTGCIFGLYSIRVGATLALKGLERHFFRPKLISSYHTTRWWHFLVPGARQANSPFRSVDVVLNPALQERLNRLRDATVNVSKRGGYFGHLLCVEFG